MMLVKLGKSLWVDPEQIDVVGWNGSRLDQCPYLILRSGQHVNVDAFVGKREDREERCEALLRHIAEKVAEGRQQAQRDLEAELGIAPTRQRYDGADPATTDPGEDPAT